MKRNVYFNCLAIVIFLGCVNANAQRTAKKMLQNSNRQKEIFKAISGDSIQMRQFKHYIIKQKKTNHIIGNEEILMGNNVNMMENDSILMKRTHRE